jgi:hypothetical protein
MSQLNIPSLATASPTVWHFVLWLHLSWYFHVHFPHIIVTFHPIVASRPFGTHVLMFSNFYFSHLWHFIPMPHFFLLCDILPIHGYVCVLGWGGGVYCACLCVYSQRLRNLLLLEYQWVSKKDSTVLNRNNGLCLKIPCCCCCYKLFIIKKIKRTRGILQGTYSSRREMLS